MWVKTKNLKYYEQWSGLRRWTPAAADVQRLRISEDLANSSFKFFVLNIKNNPINANIQLWNIEQKSL